MHSKVSKKSDAPNEITASHAVCRNALQKHRNTATYLNMLIPIMAAKSCKQPKVGPHHFVGSLKSLKTASLHAGAQTAETRKASAAAMARQ